MANFNQFYAAAGSRAGLRPGLGAPGGKPFTLLELLVVITIVAVLASLLLPALQQAKRTAKEASCVANLRQVGIAFFDYAGDNDGEFPPARMTVNGSTSYWPTLLLAHMKGGTPISYGNTAFLNSIFDCPVTPGWNSSLCWRNYGINELLPPGNGGQEGEMWRCVNIGILRGPSQTRLACDTTSWYIGRGGFQEFRPHYTVLGKMLFCDGHVEAVTAAQADVFAYKERDEFGL